MAQVAVAIHDRPSASAKRFVTDTARWAAVVNRDPTADDQFFYSVRTTGVYCRPSCGARLALRENVQFHASCQEAERAGFRPCKRCRPNEAPLAERQAEAIARVCSQMEIADESLSLDQLAESAGMSRFHFQRVFKQVTGMTPNAYASARRAARVREQLVHGSTTVTDAIYESGFGSSGRFYAEASTTLGMNAAAYRKGGAGIAIRFAVGECSLGSILVAATDKGICSILLGDDPDALARDLEDRFPQATLTA
ncbi:MAG: Ada metal-binding domain-containing protein, partial [Acidobacteriota bacterium]